MCLIYIEAADPDTSECRAERSNGGDSDEGNQLLYLCRLVTCEMMIALEKDTQRIS